MYEYEKRGRIGVSACVTVTKIRSMKIDLVVSSSRVASRVV